MEKPAPLRISVTQKSPLERLPLDLRLHIATFLTRGSGRTAQARLHSAAENIRTFMMLSKSFSRSLSDTIASGLLINGLLYYTRGNVTQAALALATVGAYRYVNSIFFSNNILCFSILRKLIGPHLKARMLP